MFIYTNKAFQVTQRTKKRSFLPKHIYKAQHCIFMLLVYVHFLNTSLDNFAKKQNTACSTISDYYGTYTNLADAIDACDSDENCAKVYDVGCNGVIFKLCKKGCQEVVSHEGSCLHVDYCETSGNFQYSISCHNKLIVKG